MDGEGMGGVMGGALMVKLNLTESLIPRMR